MLSFLYFVSSSSLYSDTRHCPDSPQYITPFITIFSGMEYTESLASSAQISHIDNDAKTKNVNLLNTFLILVTYFVFFRHKVMCINIYSQGFLVRSSPMSDSFGQKPNKTYEKINNKCVYLHTMYSS